MIYLLEFSDEKLNDWMILILIQILIWKLNLFRWNTELSICGAHFTAIQVILWNEKSRLYRLYKHENG